MRNLLKKIYRQPKEVRDNYALGIASVFTAVVCMFWVTAQLQTPLEGGSIVTDNAGPFTTLIKRSKEQFASLMATTPAATTTLPALEATSTSASTLILSEEDKTAAAAKAMESATTTPPMQPKEVLIGTTSASTTVQ